MSAELSKSPQEYRVVSAGRWPGVELVVAREEITAGVEWQICQPRHTVVVHLAGPIEEIETELAGTGALADPPMAGEAWMIPAGERYRTRARGGRIRYAELSLDPNHLAELRGGRGGAAELRARTGWADEFLYRSVERLAEAAGRGDDVGELLAHSISRSIYLHLFAGEPGRARRPRETVLGKAAARQLADYIDARLSEPIHLEQLAALAGTTVHELLPAFREAFGETPAQYIITRRLRRARWLLEHSRRGIAEIALETGFSSHSHLTTAFGGRVGMTPHEYRRTRRGRP